MRIFGSAKEFILQPNGDSFGSELQILFAGRLIKCFMLHYRPLPPLPDLEISEDTVVMAADILRVWVNHVLSIARDIAIGRNLKLFLQVSVAVGLRIFLRQKQLIQVFITQKSFVRITSNCCCGFAGWFWFMVSILCWKSLQFPHSCLYW